MSSATMNLGIGRIPREQLNCPARNKSAFTDLCSYYAVQGTARFHISRTFKKGFPIG